MMFPYYNSSTTRKVSKYGVISGPYFPVLGLNTEKYGPEITLYLNTFHAVLLFWKNTVNLKECVPATALFLKRAFVKWMTATGMTN